MVSLLLLLSDSEFRVWSGPLILQASCSDLGVVSPTQVRPPTFVMFVNDTKMFSEQYRRFMEKQLRTQIGFDGCVKPPRETQSS
jgi:GTP-binding protein